MAEEQAPVQEQAVAAEQQSAPIEKSILDKINEALGEDLKVRDENDAVSRIKRMHQLNSVVGDIAGLSAEERAILAYGRQNKGDYKKYFDLKSIDPEKVEPMEALRKKFDLENSDKPAAVREKIFEKFWNDNIADENPDRQEQLLNHFGGEAKKALAEWSKGLNPETPESPYKDWTKRVDEVIEKDEPLVIDLGEGKSIKYGVEKGKTSELATGMDDIHRWLEDRVFTEQNGRPMIDPVKAKNLILKADHAERIAAEAYRQGRADQVEELAKANGERQVVQRTAEATGVKQAQPTTLSNAGW